MRTTAFVCGSFLNLFKNIDKGLADDRVATDTDHGALPDTGTGELVHDFIGKRPAPGDHPDISAEEEP